MKTLSLPEAAAFLHCHPEWARQQAKQGRIPGAKPGKSWVFIEEDLVAYLRGHYSDGSQIAQGLKQEKTSCPSTNEKIAHTGG